MSRPTATHRRATTRAAVLTLTALALLAAPATADADEPTAVVDHDGSDGVALGEGHLQVDQPVLGGILAFDQVTVTTTGGDTSVDTATGDQPTDPNVEQTVDEPVDIGQGPVTDDTNHSDTESDSDAEVLDQTVTDPPSDAVCTDVLVRISPDRVQGDQRAVAITSQMIELGVERWAVVAWQTSPGTELTAVSIITSTGVETRTGNLTTGSADNVVELVFCGTRTTSTDPDPDAADPQPAPQPDDTGDATDPVDADPTPDSDNPEVTDDATPTTPAPPTSGGEVEAAAPSTPAPATPAPTTPADDATANDEPTSNAQAAGTVGDEDAEVALDEDAEVLGLLEDRDDTDATDHSAQPDADTDTQADPEAPADQQTGADEDAEVLGLLEDRASNDDRSTSGLQLTLLSLLVAALAAAGTRLLLRRRAAQARTTTPN